MVDGEITNGNFYDKSLYEGVAYLDYVESIYVGYRWYETADTGIRCQMNMEKVMMQITMGKMKQAEAVHVLVHGLLFRRTEKY